VVDNNSIDNTLEIINEFLMSAGYLKGAHDETCKIFNVVLLSNPDWKKYENI
jgi:DNA-3-methyladenine glycosylase I